MATADTASARILILAPIGRDAVASAELLRRAGMQAEVCKDLDELAARIDAAALAVLLAEEALFGRDFSVVSERVGTQPPWSDLPFVVLTSQLPSTNVSAWRHRLVESLRNVSLLERPVQAITLRTAMQAAVRARARQYEMRALLEAQKDAAAELEDLVFARTQQLETANKELLRQMTERARVEESLRQAQRMEAIGQLTGGIAHDFNNLLMVILGGLTMLDRHSEPARRQMLMHGIQQAAQRGAALTRQLLAFSRKQPLQAHTLDLAHQLGGMRELLDRSLGEGTQVELKLAEDLWPVHVDPGELELVVLNLAVNARDAMPSGGTITISADNLSSDQQGEVQGDWVRLAVIDTGTGMTQDVKDRAFEPFFTTKEVGKGSGLGLAQVYGFAKQSGGSVQIHSALGRGTSVVLLLPRSSDLPDELPQDSTPGPAQQPHQSSAGSVLLVEDNDQVATLVREMLQELGYKVERVGDAAAALRTLNGKSMIDLVFSDIRMPGEMDGVELGRQIRLRRQNLPILLTSGYANGAQQAERDGFHVLPKPYDLAALATALQIVRQENSTVSSDGARNAVT
jgi:signal transduction histidine kinase/ActR/RegA family two-component response regulator